MTGNAPQPVTVSILDREYVVACSAEERPGLIAAAVLLDGRMRDLRNAARNAALDRIAVLAALNLAHELQQLRQSSSSVDGAIGGELGALKGRLDGALAALASR